MLEGLAKDTQHLKINRPSSVCLEKRGELRLRDLPVHELQPPFLRAIFGGPQVIAKLKMVRTNLPVKCCEGT